MYFPVLPVAGFTPTHASAAPRFQARGMDGADLDSGKNMKMDIYIMNSIRIEFTYQ